MSNRILIVGALACLSAVAVAQSDQNNKAPVQGQTANTPDSASGQTAGKRMHKPMVMSTDASSKPAASTLGTGGKTANDDWTTAAKSDPKTGNGQTRVATGDVNGDGMPDATAKNSGHATEAITPAAASSNATQPRDVASGQTSGKRQHEPVAVTKASDAKPVQK